MAATNYAALISAIRVDADDTPTSNPQYQQVPVGTRNGTNVLFKLPDTNIVAGSVYYYYGTNFVRSSTGFTLTDAVNGYVTLSAAPDSGATMPFAFDYAFQWYPDADYQTWIDRATEEFDGGVAGTALPSGLTPALCKLVLARYWDRRSSSHANKYASSGGGESAQAQTPAQNFRSLAKAARADGIAMRDAYYARAGARKAPASGTITYGSDPYSPIR